MSTKRMNRKIKKYEKATALLRVANANAKDLKNKSVDSKIVDDHWKKSSLSLDPENTLSVDTESCSSSSDEEKPVVTKTLKMTLEEKMKKVREEMRAKQKAAMERPKLYLRLDALDASLEASCQYYWLAGPPDRPHPIMFVSDMQQLLLYAVQGNLASFKPRWCKLLRWTRVSHVVVINVDGISSTEYQRYPQCLPRIKHAYSMSVELASPTQHGSDVATELFQVPISPARWTRKRKLEQKEQRKQNKKLRRETTAKSASLTNADDDADDDVTLMSAEAVSRTQLILSPQQMIQEGYPLPVVSGPYDGFVHTSDAYGEVSDESPLFALDCEMCMTKEGQLELTWISVVDEKHDLVYDSLVKPHNPITNYLTKYSGVTRKMLENVHTRLSDVQRALRDILPDNAILCGQSLDGDLRAIKMFHPYVIDTSVIYNLAGSREIKPGLRRLTNIFLGRDIQCDDKKGHNPTEDSIATMELVKLKLSKGLGFGDVVLGGEMDRVAHLNRNAKQTAATLTQNKSVVNTEQCGAKTENGASEVCMVQNSDQSKDTERKNSCDKPANSSQSLCRVQPDNISQEQSNTHSVKSSQSGNALHSEGTSSSEEETDKAVETQPPDSVEQRKKFFERPHTKMHEGLLGLVKEAGKTVCLLDREGCMPSNTAGATCVECGTDKQAVQACQDSCNKHFMTYLHLRRAGSIFAQEEQPSEDQIQKCLLKLDKRFDAVVQAVPERALVMLVLGGRSQGHQFHHAMGFAKIT